MPAVQGKCAERENWELLPKTARPERPAPFPVNTIVGAIGARRPGSSASSPIRRQESELNWRPFGAVPLMCSPTEVNTSPIAETACRVAATT